jgi:ATP-dependent DNA ligase
MPKAFEFCIPTRSTIVLSGPDWLHEVKYDGYRLGLGRATATAFRPDGSAPK